MLSGIKNRTPKILTGLALASYLCLFTAGPLLHNHTDSCRQITSFSCNVNNHNDSNNSHRKNGHDGKSCPVCHFNIEAAGATAAYPIVFTSASLCFLTHICRYTDSIRPKSLSSIYLRAPPVPLF